MEGLTLGQVLGILPLYSELSPRHQYKSKLDGNWYDCKESEIIKYQKYMYETRSLFV
jgi:hypothetical protein